MSYAPIYSKLHELEARLVIVETAPKPNVPLSATLTAPVASLTNTSSPVMEFDLSLLAGLATKAELPDVSEFVTKAELPDVSEFVTKAELPDVSGFVTKAEIPDVSEFVTKAELPDVSGFATKAELPDVSGFATKAELPDVSEFATKTELADLQAKFDGVINVLAQLNTKLNEANEKIAALESA